MRVETINERHLLCGGILPQSSVKVGQTWAPACGSDSEVTVTAVTDDCVTYSRAMQNSQEELYFDFQCRYCLVLDTPEVPEELCDLD